ncbi:penicillin-binding protein 2 [Azonexus hydrophilus]|uniref:Peptidoglycan D,D-transpeptidase MrdA n=1 Tax=Azonexus hydrophilus TaxID=418702 RepID=A0A1R1IC44_9RHOO|nr:penicillin-binding protein 2 [Azonexus hydrophilus]OMG56242.1 penicillin-binding protein 2 [Azonexus hydrophilus]
MSDFHHSEQDPDRFRKRILFAGSFVLLCFCLLFGRFFYLQIVQHEYYATRAESNRISLVPVMPNRGNIVDRNGVILARNYSAFTLEITPSKTLGLEETIDSLGEIVEIQLKDRRRFKRLLEESKNFESIPIRTRLSDQEVARFAAQRYRFPGVEVKARLFRQYPENSLAAHAIGYISRINAKDKELIDAGGHEANYKGTEHIGKIGLEAHYEFELHGTAGHEQVEVDAGGRAVRVLSQTAPIPGNNLTLTLDAKLQAVAEQAFGDRRGSLAAIDPSNGAVLALVSSPAFDPNLFVDGIRFDDWDELNNNPDKPMLNRAIYSTHPPGSTFKPLMALAALTTGKRTPGQAIADAGYFNFGNRRFMDDKVGGHGMVDMHKSIVVSCNTYYYVLANDMGIDNIARFMGELGLGRRTEIDIPGEATGILPSPEWKQRRFKKREQQKWYPGETISIGIGQGYNAYSTLHMAHALANILNYGKVYRPHLVNTITNPTTGEVRVVEPQPVRQIDLKPEHVEVIKRGMAGVVTEGTGSRAFAGAAYESGGKTGTAQVFSLKSGQKYVAGQVKERLRDHSWYVAFAPVDKPKIVVAVMVENGGFGAQSAAPIARQVFDYHLTGRLPGGPAPEVEAPEADENTELIEEAIDEAD